MTLGHQAPSPIENDRFQHKEDKNISDLRLSSENKTLCEVKTKRDLTLHYIVTKVRDDALANVIKNRSTGLSA